MRLRAYVGENPASSYAWREPPIEAAFNRPGTSEVITHMCMYNKKRPDTREFIRKPTRLKGTKEVIDSCSRRCDGSHEHCVIEGSMKLENGKRMNVSEWAGGYTKAFAMQLLKGAERFLEKHHKKSTRGRCRKDMGTYR